MNALLLISAGILLLILVHSLILRDLKKEVKAITTKRKR